MKTKLWSSLVTPQHCCSTEYQLYSYCRGELLPACFFRHTEADVHPSPLKCTELVPWDAGGRTEGCFWDGKRLYFSTCIAAPLRLDEMERVCYEKSQSKTNGLPFVTVPEAMHTSWVKQKRILHWMLHVVPWLTWEGLFQGLPSSHVIGASWLLHCWGLL